MNLNTQKYKPYIMLLLILQSNVKQRNVKYTKHLQYTFSLNKSIYNKCYYTLNVEWEEIKYVNSVYVLFISIKYYFWK